MQTETSAPLHGCGAASRQLSFVRGDHQRGLPHCPVKRSGFVRPGRRDGHRQPQERGLFRSRFDGDAGLEVAAGAGDVRRIVRVADARLRRRKFQARNRHARVPARARRSRAGRDHVNPRLRRLQLLGPSGIALLCRAVLTLFWIRVSLWMGPWNMTTPATRAGSVRSIKPGVDRLEWAVLAASRFTPRATCLTQALALHRLLSHYGYRSNIQFGVRQADGRFAAHAWVEHDAGLLLSKAPEILQYVRFFSWPPSQPDQS